jgi:alpha-1,2-glucosyltransferase
VSPAPDSTAAASSLQNERTSRWCLALACGLTIAWFLIYANVRPDGLCDEAGHLGIIYHLHEGKAGFPDAMPMLPGYHFLVLGLSFGHPTLTTARLVTLATALLAIFAFAAAWRRFHGQPPGPAALLLALLPVMQPFTAMAYSDVPALAWVLCMWWAHLAGHRKSAALLFAVACFFRQTNIVWGVFILAWEASQALWPATDEGSDRPPGLARWRAALSRVWVRGGWLLGVIAVAGVLAAIAGRLTVGDQHGNQFRPNIATLHFAGVLFALLGLPLWIAGAGPALQWLRQTGRQHPVRTSLAAALAAGTTGLLAATFANPHVWNRELFWPDCTFTLLRNWPLVGIDTHPWLRWWSAANVVGVALALLAGFARQPHRRALWLSLLVGSVPAMVNSLVEPRYFIPPLVFLLFFLRLDRRMFCWLAGWFGFLCLVHAPWVAAGLSLW